MTTTNEAKRKGGTNHSKERYGIDGARGVDEIRRILDIAIIDTLTLENSIGRSRTLAQLVHLALRTLEATEIERRLQRLEQATEIELGRWP